MFAKKRRISSNSRLFTLVLAISLVLSTAGCGSNPASSGGTTAETTKRIELKLASFFPATHPVETEITQGWIIAVDKATNGRVKVTSYPAETLLKSAETYEGVVKGVSDIGMSAYAYTRGRFPVVETFLLPGILNKNSMSASYSLMEGIKTLNPKELQDTHHLFSWASGPGNLMSKAPYRALNDIQGLQIGASTGLVGDALKLLGATPITMPMPEWYEALQKGIMKGGLSAGELLKGFRLGDVTGDYITQTPFIYNQAFFVTMNLDKWNSIPADVQKQITQATEDYYGGVVPGMWDKINAAGVKYTQDKKKVEIITLSESETAKWLDLLKPMHTDYIAVLNGKGLEGEKILTAVMDIVDKNNYKY
ncbi:TRAP transporter substrate-binding protein [Desulfosporosinus shakirovi]|uniref:TRAP transporter substrate-binding protein n=1 Tax=Desulfosporosinus shakirovi TaxID=2885154 RepID=UPI001E317DE4|nr:TRAP transporter substrate-binding protein [Desulfosporosinus sp. SRJS8]MCB8816419.1 TRAP transporter substrate-binding protein [Desulfosporosinus sp. SRJS8]